MASELSAPPPWSSTPPATSLDSPTSSETGPTLPCTSLSRVTTPSPMRKAFGGHVIGSTARLRRLKQWSSCTSPTSRGSRKSNSVTATVAEPVGMPRSSARERHGREAAEKPCRGRDRVRVLRLGHRELVAPPPELVASVLEPVRPGREDLAPWRGRNSISESRGGQEERAVLSAREVVLRRIGEDGAGGGERDESDALHDTRGIDDRLLRLRRHPRPPVRRATSAARAGGRRRGASSPSR